MFTPSDKWTFSAWIRPLEGSGSNSYAALLSGGRAIGYQRVYYRFNGYSEKQPGYISSNIGSGVPSNGSVNVSDSQMCDGNWHHVAVTADGTGIIRTFYDGTQIRQDTESNNIDWGATVGTGILGELRGDGNAYACGYFDDICLISGEALWTEDFTPPTGYLSPINYNISSLEVN